MRRDQLTDLYVDTLRRDPNAVPPPGLDDETAAVIRALVHAERIPPGEQMTHRTRTRLWAEALQAHAQTQKENFSMTAYSLPRAVSRGSTYAFAAVASVIVVLFAAALINLPGGSGLPDNGGSNGSGMSGAPLQAAQATQEADSTETPTPPVDVQMSFDRAQLEAQIAALQAQIDQLQAVLDGEQPSISLVPANLQPSVQVIQGADGEPGLTITSNTAVGGTITTLVNGDTVTWVPSIQALTSVPDGGLYGVYGIVESSGTVTAAGIPEGASWEFHLLDGTGQIQVTLPQTMIQQFQLPVGGSVIVIGTVDQTQPIPAMNAFIVSNPGMLIQQGVILSSGAIAGGDQFLPCPAAPITLDMNGLPTATATPIP